MVLPLRLWLGHRGRQDKDKRQVFIEPQCFDVMDEILLSLFRAGSTASAGGGTAFPHAQWILPIYMGFTRFPPYSSSLGCTHPASPIEGTAFAFP